jgi:hypothetical protein
MNVRFGRVLGVLAALELGLDDAALDRGGVASAEDRVRAGDRAAAVDRRRRLRAPRRGNDRGGVMRTILALGCLVSTSAAAQDPFLGVPEGGGPIECGPVPEGLRAIDAASCGECHPRHYQEWQRSAHRSSFTNTLFREEFRHRESPFCARCHSPRRDENAGIDCAACHVRDGAVLAVSVSGRAPHPSRARAELAGPHACARCHQFPFEGQPELLLQAAVDEWMQSDHRDESCQSCHMPARGGRHAHDFPGGLDRELLDGVIRVDAQAVGREVRFTLENIRAGHSVPTGDVFRRIVVRAWPLDDRRAEVRTVLGRTYRFLRDGTRRPLADTRIPPRGTRHVVLTLARPARRIGWSIELWRTHPGRAREHGWRSSDVSRTLAQGVLRR